MDITRTSDPSLANLQGSIAKLKQSLATPQYKRPPKSLYQAHNFEIIAALYEQAGQYNNAELAYLKAFEITESTFGAGNLVIIPIADSLGSFYFRHKRYAAAEIYIQKWVKASENNLPAQRANLAMALNNLGLLYKAEDRGAEAIEALQRSLENAVAAPEVTPLQLGTIANRLAVLCVEEQRPEDAMTYFKIAAAAFDEGGAAGLHSAAAVFQNMALLYVGQKRFSEATEPGLKALSLIAQENGTDNTLLFDSLVTLAAAYSGEMRFDEAEPLLILATETAAREFPSNDQRYAIACNNLALVYRALSRTETSAVWFEKALKAGEIAFGADEPWVAAASLGLAVAYAELNEAAKAEVLFKRAIGISMQRLGPSHLLLASALYDLSLLYSREQRFGEAEALLQQAMVIRQQKLGAFHPGTREVENALLWVQVMIKRQEDKIEGAQKVLSYQANLRP